MPTVLLLWGPSRLVGELRALLVPELCECCCLADPRGRAPAEGEGHSVLPQPLDLQAVGNGFTATMEVQAADLAVLLEAAGQSALLTAVLAVVGRGDSLLAAAEAARTNPTVEVASHPLRPLSLDPAVPRSVAERAMRRTLAELGFGRRPVDGSPTLWAIQWRAGDHPGAEVLLGTELAKGIQAASPQGGPGGPTAMQPALALATCSLAGVRSGAVALDPFCGSGALLIAARRRGATLAVGTDVAATHFGPNDGGPGVVRLQCDIAHLPHLLPASCVHCIVTDVPYGHRTEVVVPDAGAENVTEAEWQQLLRQLLALAGKVLVDAGRLAVWLPYLDSRADTICHNLGPPDEPPLSPNQQHGWLLRCGAAEQLWLLSFLPETRLAGFRRAVAVFERQPRADSPAGPVDGKQEELLRVLLAAGALLPSDAATELGPALLPGHPDSSTAAAPAPRTAGAQQRGVSYRSVRATHGGTDMDVWRAAWLGDTAALQEYADAGGDVNAQDTKGQTPLQFAAGFGREAAVALLLARRADPACAADAKRMPALHRAAAHDHGAVLRRLLAERADVWQRSGAGQTPLMLASLFGHDTAAEILLSHLISNPSEDDCDLVRHLALVDSAGLTALHLAAQWGMTAVMLRLLQAGADPNVLSSCPERLSPAHLAARWGHAAVLQLLQQHGADLHRPSGAGRRWTPLQEAEEWRRPACVELLRPPQTTDTLPSP